jgi:hypothetical protein
LSIPTHTYRTHNRNRSLSFINSDQLVNVNKGSRHIKPVTLGKRLALIIEHQAEIQSMESARPKVWIETMDKEATSCASDLNGYVNGRFREKS